MIRARLVYILLLVTLCNCKTARSDGRVAPQVRPNEKHSAQNATKNSDTFQKTADDAIAAAKKFDTNADESQTSDTFKKQAKTLATADSGELSKVLASPQIQTIASNLKPNVNIPDDSDTSTEVDTGTHESTQTITNTEVDAGTYESTESITTKLDQPSSDDDVLVPALAGAGAGLAILIAGGLVIGFNGCIGLKKKLEADFKIKSSGEKGRGVAIDDLRPILQHPVRARAKLAAARTGAILAMLAVAVVGAMGVSQAAGADVFLTSSDPVVPFQNALNAIAVRVEALHQNAGLELASSCLADNAALAKDESLFRKVHQNIIDASRAVSKTDQALISEGVAGALGTAQRTKAIARELRAANEHFPRGALEADKGAIAHLRANLGVDAGVLGKGGFGVVRKVQLGSKTYAVKQLDPNASALKDKTQDEIDEAFAKEIAQLEALPRDNPNLVHYLGAYKDANEQWNIVLEFSEFGTLRDFAKSKQITVDQTVGMLSGVKALHDAKIAHLDLKTENVLVFKDGDGSALKVNDFGLAAPAGNGVLRPGGGTPGYFGRENQLSSALREFDVRGGDIVNIYARKFRNGNRDEALGEIRAVLGLRPDADAAAITRAVAKFRTEFNPTMSDIYALGKMLEEMHPRNPDVEALAAKMTNPNPLARPSIDDVIRDFKELHL